MGLEKEIETLFERVVALDLARISRLAQPSRHAIPTTPYPSRFSVQGGTVEQGSIRLVLDDLDYQATKVILDPLDLEHLQAIAARRKLRRRLRRDHGVGDEVLEDKAAAGDTHEAFHRYHDEVGGSAFPVKSRMVEIDSDPDVRKGPEVTAYPIIQVAGVDYVLSGRYNDVERHLNYPHGKLVDTWPQEIVLRGLVGGRNQTYVRADVAAQRAAKREPDAQDGR
jgi:hypothetical protein